MSLGTFEKYEDAQKLVDTLSDKEFPVQNCLIVGTDLKQLERITGRLTWGRVLLGGAGLGGSSYGYVPTTGYASDASGASAGNNQPPPAS